MKKTYFFFLILLTLSSCAGIRGMRVQVLRPAKLTVPADIQRIAILNRSIPAAATGAEAALTLELGRQDKQLSEECIRGLNELLLTSERFVVKRVGYSLPAADPKSLTFGQPLDWEIVDSICARMEVDALLVMEYFDTDFTIDNAAGTTAQAVQSVMNGGQTSVEASGTATSSSGFRVYYSTKHQIPFEEDYRYKKRWRKTANNLADAVAKLIKRSEALVDVSYSTGEAFAMDIVPLYYWEDRDLYKGKKGDMERAERQALAKDWKGAFKTWNSTYEFSTKKKIRAKAAFNMALAQEVLGNLEEAQKWAAEAYVEGGKKEMLHYVEILDARIREQQKLNEQLDSFE